MYHTSVIGNIVQLWLSQQIQTSILEICMCLVDEAFLEFNRFKHLLQALIKPDGSHLHLLELAY